MPGHCRVGCAQKRSGGGVRGGHLANAEARRPHWRRASGKGGPGGVRGGCARGADGGFARSGEGGHLANAEGTEAGLLVIPLLGTPDVRTEHLLCLRIHPFESDNTAGAHRNDFGYTPMGIQTINIRKGDERELWACTTSRVRFSCAGPSRYRLPCTMEVHAADVPSNLYSVQGTAQGTRYKGYCLRTTQWMGETSAAFDRSCPNRGPGERASTPANSFSPSCTTPRNQK